MNEPLSTVSVIIATIPLWFIVVYLIRLDKRSTKQRASTGNRYRITAEVDDQWFDILGQITRHQEGFIWNEVEEIK